MVSLRHRECGPSLLQPASFGDSTLCAGAHPPRVQETDSDGGLCLAFHVGGLLPCEGKAPALCPLGTDSICGINGLIFLTPMSLACCPLSWIRLWTALKMNWLWDFSLSAKWKLPGSPLFLQKPQGARTWRAQQEWVGLLCRPAWQHEKFSCLCL